MKSHGDLWQSRSSLLAGGQLITARPYLSLTDWNVPRDDGAIGRE